jgi:hypothetical protein
MDIYPLRVAKSLGTGPGAINDKSPMVFALHFPRYRLGAMISLNPIFQEENQ